MMSIPEPWAHQRNAVDKMFYQPAVLLAMEMGTGKSRVVVDAVHHLKLRRVLVVCPLAVIDVWRREFEKFARSPVHVLCLNSGTASDKVQAMFEAFDRNPDSPVVVVVNYESVWRSPLGPMRANKTSGRMTGLGAVMTTDWDVVVLDESHRIKTPGSKVSKFMELLGRRVPRRWCLTGTPMHNSPLDVYAQFRFLDPTVFGNSYAAFCNKFAILGGFQNRQVLSYKDLDGLHLAMRPLTYRVTQKEVLDLPPCVMTDIPVKLPPRAMTVYKDLKREAVAELQSGVVTTTNILTKIVRMQQVVSGYLPVQTADFGTVVEELHDAKGKVLLSVFEDLDVGEPVVVFTKFHHDLDTVAKVAQEAGKTYVELSGRVNQLSEWQSGKSSVLGVQIQSGSSGIDLTRARIAVFYSLTHSLGEYEQAKARLVRPGQTRKVLISHMLGVGTIDEHIMRALRGKHDVVKSVMDEFKRGV